MIPEIKTKYLTRVIVISIILLLSVLSPTPKEALAIPGAFVPTNDVELNITTSGIFGINGSAWTRKSVLDTIAYAAANTVIKKISANLQNRILKAANSFVKNLKKDLIDIENKVGKDLGIQINAVQGCFPNLDLSLVPEPAWTPLKFKLSLTCTPALSKEMRRFYENGEFSWDTFKKITEDPAKYNPFGGVLSVNAEFSRRKQAAKQRELEQLKWGRGMRGVKDALTGLIKTPAAQVQGIADWAFSARMDRTKQADVLGEVLIQTVSALTANALNGTFQ